MSSLYSLNACCVHIKRSVEQLETILTSLSLRLDHLPGDLEGGQEAPELYLLARACHQSPLQLRQLDQDLNLDLAGQLQPVYVEVDLREDVLQAQS